MMQQSEDDLDGEHGNNSSDDDYGSKVPDTHEDGDSDNNDNDGQLLDRCVIELDVLRQSWLKAKISIV